ncbi:DNA-directed DNA polymerase epsilon, subunit B [Trapelia coarctata]|nr:DNA-directed DNA polymerase epsilon, subunit B [Trapelia coarctata]
MSGHSKAHASRVAPLFNSAKTPAPANIIPSSSPAFGTPVHPIRFPDPKAQRTRPTILPILLPPVTLRPLAFRTFTKKHNFTLNSAALQALSTFIGKFCGSGWREEGLAEGVLEETAKLWKRDGGGLIIDGEGNEFKEILRALENCMSGGRILHQENRESSRRGSSAVRVDAMEDLLDSGRPGGLDREDSQTSLGFSSLDVDDEQGGPDKRTDPRRWLKVIGAFEQPRLIYNIHKKHFEKPATAPSLFPDPSHNTQLFRNRYNLIHQRLLRNESFQTPTIAVSRTPSLQRSSSTMVTTQQAYKLTPIANLLGRSGSSHVLLGLLTIAPTGTLAISDLTGSISLDLQHARPIPEKGAWFTPGMIVIVDGIYEEEGSASSNLGGGGGVGGTIGGKFIGLSIGGPPCERRDVTLGVSGAGGKGDQSAGGGFGWVDFLGVGSERATGPTMRKMEWAVLGRQGVADAAPARNKMLILGEVNLDSPKAVQALRKVLGLYAAGPEENLPMTIVLVGNFVQHAVMAGGGSGGSIEYKEYFDSLASALSDYPSVLQVATFVFVPGDNDPWVSAFSAGGATALPRQSVPDLFTSRVKKVFTSANSDAEKSLGTKTDGEAMWTSNPARLTLFGPAQEIVVFRDDISGRLRRSAITFQGHINEAQERDHDPAEVVEDSDERMDIDEAVVAAESHVLAPKAKESSGSSAEEDVQTARKLVKTILDQGHLSPFPLTSRPVLWDYAGALQLYPLPSALILVDPEASPFNVTYEGCHVMNPGRLVGEGRKGLARWTEYDASTRRGKTKEVIF